MRIKLETDGTNIFVRTSRPLRDNEHVCLLRRGRSICTTPYGTYPTHPKSKYRWHVYYRWSGEHQYGNRIIKNLRYPWHLDDDGKLCFDAPTHLPYRWFIDYVRENGNDILPPDDETIPHPAYGMCSIEKANASSFIFGTRNKDGWRISIGRRRVCFGIAVYRELPYKPQSNPREIYGVGKKIGGYRHKRVSNVRYFRSWIEIKGDYTEVGIVLARQWITV